MTDEERQEAEENGRFDNPPMSLLGIVDGMAAVNGKATAQLIAAAPELLEALERVVKSATPSLVDNPSMYAAWEVAHAAIAKAKGGES